jgi:anti-sigma factor RsiW
MSGREQRAWTISALPEAHLVPDAVVAFVDGELSSLAHDRAASHIARCPLCAAETMVQRQARAAVRAAAAPRMPAGLLAALCNIPTDTDLPPSDEHLAMTEDGQLVAVQRPDRAFGAGPVIGSSAPLGDGNVLRTGAGHGRRAVQGAGVVAAGLMLGALAMVGPHVLTASSQTTIDPARGDGASVSGDGAVIQANFSAPLGGGVMPREPAPEMAPHLATARVR